MSISLINHIGFTADSQPTAAINTTGATLLVAIVNDWYDDTLSVSDSKGNTWYSLTRYGQVEESGFLQIFYAYDHGGSALSVGSGHTFSCNSADYIALTITAWSGTDTTSNVFESGSDHGAHSSSKTAQPGSVTPNATGDLIITGRCDGYASNTAPTIDLSFNVIEDRHNGNDMSAAQAYLITTDTNSKNPTWTCETSTYSAVCIAVFKQAAGGATTDHLWISVEYP